MNQPQVRRPQSLDEMRRVLANLVTGEGFAKGLAFRPREGDLLLSPFSKCGTTWLQQIVHTLRTRGDMDFDDISRVVPWIEVAHDVGIDLEAPQRGRPRAFKSHLDWGRIPKGGRYIVSLRDPKDALLSAYRFMEGWFFERGAIELESWARARFLADRKTGFWNHLSSWWAQRKRPDVLLLCFEDLVEDLPGAVDRIASFAEIPIDAELRSITLEHASFGFMKGHGDRFDDRLMRVRSEEVCGLPAGSDAAKVREGKVGGHRAEVPAAVLETLDQIWDEDIAARIGVASYSALRNELRPSG